MAIFHNNQNILVGYDIGGTKTEIVLIDAKTHRVVSKERHPTERDKGYEHILDVMKNLLLSQMKNLALKSAQIQSIGLALPGSVDPQSNQMTLGNTHVLENRPIKDDLQNLLAKDLDRKIPIYCANDANCFALAEYHHSHTGKNIVGIILGTGVGGGIIINGKILQGRRGSGGEIGHTTFTKNFSSETECYCGQNNCVELLLSGPGFESFYHKKTGQKKPLKEIFAEPTYLQIYREGLAFFLAQLTNVLDPDVFVLGGGISLEKSLYKDLQSLMTPHLFYKKNPPLVVQHAISDSAGGIGAALFTNDA